MGALSIDTLQLLSIDTQVSIDAQGSIAVHPIARASCQVVDLRVGGGGGGGGAEVFAWRLPP